MLRLAGFTDAMREHVPVLLAKLRERFPGLKATLQEIDQRGAEHLIAQGETDLAIMVLESKLPPGFRSVTLASLPLYLLAGPINHIGARQTRTNCCLGCFKRKWSAGTLFGGQRWRRVRRILYRSSAQWTRSGLAVQTPELQHDSGLRVLPLSGFPSLPIGLFRCGKLGEIAQVFVDELAARAKRIFGKPEDKV